MPDVSVEPVVSDWIDEVSEPPVDEPLLSLDEREELQQRLIDRGLLAGSADGVIGLKSRKAIRTFQLQVGLPADGFATKAFLEELRRRQSS